MGDMRYNKELQRMEQLCHTGTWKPMMLCGNLIPDGKKTKMANPKQRLR